jgi:hypothetical protein
LPRSDLHQVDGKLAEADEQPDWVNESPCCRKKRMMNGSNVPLVLQKAVE